MRAMMMFFVVLVTTTACSGISEFKRDAEQNFRDIKDDVVRQNVHISGFTSIPYEARAVIENQLKIKKGNANDLCVYLGKAKAYDLK